MKISYVLPDPLSYASWDEFDQDLACMKQLGYDAVECQISEPDDIDEAQLSRSLEAVDYHLVAFQTGTSYYTRGNCLSSPDAQVRQRTVDLLKRFVDFSRRFGSIIVFGSLQGRASDEPDHTTGRERILAAMKTVADYATAKGAVIAFEPVNHLETAYHNTIDSVTTLVRDFQQPGLQMMIDTFHMNIEETSLTDCLPGIQDILKHVHVSETNRDVPGRGHLATADFFQKLNDIGYDGPCSLGVYQTTLPRQECMRICYDAVATYL